MEGLTSGKVFWDGRGRREPRADWEGADQAEGRGVPEVGGARHHQETEET